MNAKADYIEVCEKAARAGGAVLLEKLGRVEVREKGPSDLVTEADFASQEAVSRTVLGAFPDHLLIGEEGDAAGGAHSRAAADDATYRWIVDPLDGTTNYVHQVPHFAVSVALERAGQLLVGAVYNPVSGECYSAAAGRGAYLNGKRLRASTTATLSQAVASVGFPAVVTDDCPDLRLFLKAVTRCQSIRRTGSASLNLCYVAAGRFDAAWSFSTKAWDVAAGALLIREAGGIVTSPDGGSLAPDTGRFLAAATRPLHAELLALTIEAGLA